MIDLTLKCMIRKVKYKSYKGNIGKITPNLIWEKFKSKNQIKNGQLM